MTDNETWPEYLNITEVAAVMKVSKMTVYRLVHKGDIEATRVGRSFRIDAAHLRDYLKVRVPA
jgi:excisionase family DNA binding protein